MTAVSRIQDSPLKQLSESGGDGATEPFESASNIDTESSCTSLDDIDGEVVTQEELDEEEKHEQDADWKEEEEVKKKRCEWIELEENTKEERYKRLQKLLMKSNLYTQYLLGRMERQKEDEKKKREASLKRQAKAAEKKLGKTEEDSMVEESTDLEVASSNRQTRSRQTLRAPVSKAKISQLTSPSKKSSPKSPSTPGKELAKTPKIEGAKDNVNVLKTPDDAKMSNVKASTPKSTGSKNGKSPKQPTPSSKAAGSPSTEKENSAPDVNVKQEENNKFHDFEECLRDLLGEKLIARRSEDSKSGEENEDPLYSISKHGRKRKNNNYNEQSPTAAKLLTDFFKPSLKRRKVEEKAEDEEESKEDIKQKMHKALPEMDLFTGESDIDPDGTIRRPALLTGGKLRQYQVEGLNWLKVLFENGVNGILADEMGLGKTIQCVATICQIIMMGAVGPFIVIAPLSTLHNWKNEFERFAPRLPLIFYHGDKETRTKLQNKMRKLHTVLPNVRIRPIVITSYEIAMNDRPRLVKYDWTYMIVDEGHRLKNRNCRLIRELKQYKNTHRLLLTGTPLQNDMKELWSLLNFLLPEIFDDLGSFEMWFDIEVLSTNCADDAIIEEEKEKNILGMLHQILTPFMLRRVKSDVDLEIPPKKELLVYAPLSDVQRQFYSSTVDRTILKKMGVEVEPAEEEVELDAKGRPRRGRGSMKVERSMMAESEVRVSLNNIMMQLRKVCNHPYLINYPLDPGGNYLMTEELVTKCGKMLILDKMLPELRRRGHKVLIFSQMTKMLDILQDYMCIRGIEFRRLDGSYKVEERQEAMDSFNSDPDVWVFLLSTRAGGLGVNLVAADTVIIYDSDWNPQSDLQAQDRCHRIGQTRPVMVYRFVTANTIDQKIVERAAGKRRLEKMIIHKGKFKEGIQNFSTEIKPLQPEELKELLKSTDYTGVIGKTNDGEVMSKEELDALLDRSEIVKEFEDNKKQKMRNDAATLATS